MAIGFKPDKTKSAKVSADEDVEVVEDLKETDGEGTSNVPSKKVDPKMIVIIAVVAVVIILGYFMLTGNSKGTNDVQSGTEVSDDTTSSTSSTTSGTTDDDSEIFQGNDIYYADGTTKDSAGINPGVQNYDDDSNMTTGATVYSSSDFIKDLNGMDVSAVYNVDSIDFVEDYVSYETRRAITADGMELYWLEATYNNKPYRIQIPFYYYKNLGDSGICKVNVEVLTLVGGGKVISYMQVIPEDDE